MNPLSRVPLILAVFVVLTGSSCEPEDIELYSNLLTGKPIELTDNQVATARQYLADNPELLPSLVPEEAVEDDSSVEPVVEVEPESVAVVEPEPEPIPEPVCEEVLYRGVWYDCHWNVLRYVE